MARYTRGLEELQQQLGRPVPWKWRQLNPGTVIEAEVVLQEAAAELGLTLEGKGEPTREPELADTEEWPVDVPFVEDDGGEGWPE